MTFVDYEEVKGNVLFSKSTWFLKNFQCKKQSQESLNSLKIFEIIYFSFLNIHYRGFVQKYLYTKTGRVPELLINSEKASTPHVFDGYIGRFSRLRFSMIRTHDQFADQFGKLTFSP